MKEDKYKTGQYRHIFVKNSKLSEKMSVLREKTWLRPVLFVVMLVALLIFALFFYNREKQLEHDNLRTVLKTGSSVRDKLLETWSGERIADTRTFLRTRPGMDEIISLITNPDDIGIRSAIQNKLKIYSEEYKYTAIILADTEGGVLLSYPEYKGNLDSSTLKKMARIASDTSTTEAVEFYYCKLHKTWHLDLMLTIEDESGVRKGVMIFRLDPEKFILPVIRNNSAKFQTMQNLLLKREGNMVEILSPLPGNGLLTESIPLHDFERIEVLAVYGKRGFTEGTDHEGRELVAHISQVDGTEWVILSKIDYEEAYREIFLLRWLLIALSCVVSTIALITMFLIVGVKEKNIIKHLKAKEEELLETQSALSKEITNVVTLMSNLDGMVLRYNNLHERVAEFVSPGAIDLTGYTPEEFLSDPALLRELINPEDWLQIELESHKALDRREKFDLSYRITTKSGETKWVLEKGGAVYDRDENFLYIESVVFDNDEAVNALKLSQENEEKFRLMILNSPDVTIVTGKDGTISYASPQSEQVLKYSPEFLMGKSIFDLISRKERDTALDIILEAISGKMMVEREYRFLNGNGEMIWINHIASPLVMQGEVKQIYNKITDVTKSRKASENIELFKRSVDQSPAIVLIADRNGVIEYSNKTLEEDTGYRHEEFMEISPSITTGIEKNGYDHKEVWSTVIADKEWHGEVPGKRKNGEEVWYEKSIYPVIDEDGEVHHYVSTLVDITAKHKLIEDLIKAKEKAEEMSRLKSNFLANMSHELRTPLISIMGFAEIILDESKDDHMNEMAGQVFKGGQRLSNTLNLLLTFANLESSKIKPVPEELDIISETQPLLDEMKEQAVRKGLEFTCVSEGEDLFAYSDRKFINEIVRNLVDNAIKFTMSGRVSVEFGRSGGSKVFIKVTDTGIGISKEDIKLIFEEFRQASEGFSRAYEGVGLGLTLVRRMVDLLEGELKVESQPGFGSCFTIILPGLKEE